MALIIHYTPSYEMRVFSHLHLSTKSTLCVTMSAQFSWVRLRRPRLVTLSGRVKWSSHGKDFKLWTKIRGPPLLLLVASRGCHCLADLAPPSIPKNDWFLLLTIGLSFACKGNMLIRSLQEVTLLDLTNAMVKIGRCLLYRLKECTSRKGFCSP
jgi:hypothetical protein